MNGRLLSRLLFATVLLSDGKRLETLGQVARSLTLNLSPVTWVSMQKGSQGTSLIALFLKRQSFDSTEPRMEGVSMSNILEMNVWSRYESKPASKVIAYCP